MASAGARLRPIIEPIRTDYSGIEDGPFSSRSSLTSPLWSASVLSPMSRLPPIYPEHLNDQMRRHDRATVDRLSPSRRSSPGAELPTPRIVLQPISEVDGPTPTSAFPARRLPSSAPALKPPILGRQTIMEQTRNMLLHDPQDKLSPTSQLYGRRQSAPASAMMAKNAGLQRYHEHMRRQRNTTVYGLRKPDILVIPIELRRLSTVSSGYQDRTPVSPIPRDGRLTVRVIIHSQGRKPMMLTRNFDLEELRATIPHSLSPRRTSQVNRRASTIGFSSPTTLAPPLSPVGVNIQTSRRRHSSSVIRGVEPLFFPLPERRASRLELPPTPMHFEYARTYLPVLASIILSEIVRPGDTIELPLPHPLSWNDTVDYVYTGRALLTEPIKQNILYLGGKV